MRAKMSDAGIRHDIDARVVGGTIVGRDAVAFVAEWAENEARAILAETEPIPNGFSTADRMYRGPFLLVEPFEAERALAEALTAFVE